jgi:hypothetical protein
MGISGTRRVFQDIFIDSPKDVYIDLAINYHCNSPGTTFVWRTKPYQSRLGSEILDIFFPGTTLLQTCYRHDMFAHFQNLGGFNYTCKSAPGLGEYGIFKLQAYMGFKTPFFSRRSGSRHGFDEKLDQLYNTDLSDFFMFVSIIIIFLSRVVTFII